MGTSLFSSRLALAFLVSGTAFAQSEPEPAQLAPLIVTAQKRGQSIEEVPIAITAYSGTFLETVGATRYEDLAPLVPGFFVSSQAPNNPSINIRGVGSDSLDPRSEARISIFQDGVAISRAPGSVTELFDLERVEVLKGPQSTLFGRNAGAGAISLVSRKPADAYEASLTVGTGNFGRRHFAGYVNAPLESDQLLARIAFTAENRDGVVENLADGSDLNSRDTVALRPSLRWLPGPDTTLDVVFNFQRDTPAGVAFKSGVIPTSRGDTSPFTPAQLTRGSRLGIDRTVWGASATLSHRLSPNWTLNAISAWRSYDAFERFDGDGSALLLLESNDRSSGRQLSQEIRLNVDLGHRFAGFIGAVASRERATEGVDVFVDERQLWPFLSNSFRSNLLASGIPAPLVSAAVPNLPPLTPQLRLPLGFAAFAAVPPLAPLAALAGAPLKPLHADRYTNDAALDAADVFADGTWRVTNRLELTAGGRLLFEKQIGGFEAPVSPVPSTIGFLLNASPNFAVAPSYGRLTEHDSSTGWAGRAIARYLLAPGTSAYASLSRGRRPASLIITSTDRFRASEETLLNTEVGVKGHVLAGRLQYSAALFEYRYRHFQTSVQDPTNVARFITIDAGRGTGRGGELSLRGVISNTLTTFATYGYTDATFDDTGENGAPQRYAGSTFRLTARHTASAGATFEHSAGRAGVFSFTPVWQYKSAYFFDDDNTKLGGALRQPGFALVNLRLGWRSADRLWEAVIYADNVLDKEYLIDGGNIGASFGLPTFVRGEPRLFGIDLTRRW
jgi:outer membrane receptor protein involved in Fe transport